MTHDRYRYTVCFRDDTPLEHPLFHIPHPHRDISMPQFETYNKLGLGNAHITLGIVQRFVFLPGHDVYVFQYSGDSLRDFSYSDYYAVLLS